MSRDKALYKSTYTLLTLLYTDTVGWMSATVSGRAAYPEVMFRIEWGKKLR